MNATLQKQTAPLVRVESTGLFGLELHSAELYERLQKAVAIQRNGRCEVALEDLCGAIQLIQAGQSNLRDAERMNYLETMVADWPGVLMRKMPDAVFYGPEVSIRMTIDVAMSNDPNAPGERPLADSDARRSQ